MIRFFTLLIPLAVAFAQDPGRAGAAIVSQGYNGLAPLKVSRGQITTLFVRGIGFAVPGGIPTLPGISDLSITGDYQDDVTERQYTASVLAIRPFFTCDGMYSAGACASIVAVTIQFPAEVYPSCQSCTSYVSFVPVYQGSVGAETDGVLVPDQVHFRSACDTLAANEAIGLYTPGDGTCPKWVTHLDGTPVSPTSPAIESEELVAYAVGLGQTNPPMTTGEVVMTAAPTVLPFMLDFNFRANALATQPTQVDPNTPLPQPLFAGSVPGDIGKYQIHFVVPLVPDGTPACSDTVKSNLTVSIGGLSSFDGAGICVDPNSPNTSTQIHKARRVR